MKINFLKLIRKQVTLRKKELFQNKDVSLIDISTLITFIKKLRSSYVLSSLSWSGSHSEKTLIRTLAFTLSEQINNFQYVSKTQKEIYFLLLPSGNDNFYSPSTSFTLL